MKIAKHYNIRKLLNNFLLTPELRKDCEYSAMITLPKELFVSMDKINFGGEEFQVLEKPTPHSLRNLPDTNNYVCSFRKFSMLTNTGIETKSLVLISPMKRKQP